MATVTYDKATRIYPGADRPSVDSLDIEIADGRAPVLRPKSSGIRGDVDVGLETDAHAHWRIGGARL